MLESTLSAEVGERRRGRAKFCSAFLSPAPFEFLNALNSGGLGAEPPCPIDFSTIHLLLVFNGSGRNRLTPILFLRVLEPEAADVKLQDDTMVHHPIDGGSRCHGVLEDLLPFGKGKIARDHD